MENKVYVISYASYFDFCVYTETCDVYSTLEKAQAALERDFKSVLEEDFEGEEDSIEIFKTDMDFHIENIDGTHNVAEKIQEKTIVE